MKFSVLLILGLLLGPAFVNAQSFAPDEKDRAERQYFDFLIGKWKIVEATTTEGITKGEDTYTFRKAFDGRAIISEWYFNRGTQANPNYTKGLYYSAYDNLTNTWSFYYISAASAQYYQGKKENGRWYFFREFTIQGNTFVQRQSWELRNESTLIRTIENSTDEGQHWNKVYEITLEKTQSWQ